MSTEEDIEKEEKETTEAPEASSRESASETGRDTDVDKADAASDAGSDEVGDLGVPAQLGTRRFVYAAYFAAGIGLAFLLSKMVSAGWTRLSLWKPEFGEPRDEIVMAASGIIGAAVAIFYYRDQKTRTLIDEVASELSKVTWPSRDTVMNSTFVVIVTTLLATTFFALMDRFWGFVTNLVYGA